MVDRQEEPEVRRLPARTPEEGEQRMISLAVSLAERQLMDGTATAQVITHYLKLGSSREALEQDKLDREIDLLEAKREAVESAKRVEELYAQALAAMRTYSGQESEEEYYDDSD